LLADARVTNDVSLKGSDVIYFRVLGSDTVVLNSREAAVELLDQRSGIYSDRPRMVMAGEL
jgi:hypothetical protein